MKGIVLGVILVLSCIFLSASLSSAFANTIKMEATLTTNSMSHISRDKKEQNYILIGEKNTPVSIHINFDDEATRTDGAYNHNGRITLPAELMANSQSFITIEHQ